jgi:GTP pyrophosphokinase
MNRIPETPDAEAARDVAALVEAWLDELAATRDADDVALIRHACEFGLRAHAHQMRASGEPYFHHALAVARILAELRLDHETLAAAILHDVVEDTEATLETIEAEFGASVAKLVDGVTKMRLMPDYREHSEDQKKNLAQAESLRKMLLAMAQDVRVVLIKLADRLHNMRTLGHLPPDKQQRIARETLDIYTPLANRLGIWQIKWELEDLSLRYLEPETYRKIAGLLDERRSDREAWINEVSMLLKRELDKVGIQVEISGRPKHIYSIWRKMQRKGVDFHHIFDVRAVRVQTTDIAACYAVLGIVHGLWHHLPGEFDDYIARPKDNLYQSLHTAVIGPQGKALEVQIRTREMHEHAELGVAAHWRYKEGSKFDTGFDQKIAWLRRLLEWKDEDGDAGDFIDRFKAEVYQDRVYVLTPRGAIVDLPHGSTPLDFAYYIHTDVGHRCRGAKVNGNIVPLTTELRSGDQVEVLTAKQGVPSRDWLNAHLGYLKSSQARNKVRSWFKQQDQDKNIAAGRIALERELKRLGMTDVNLTRLAARFRFEEVDEFTAAIGRGDLTTGQIAHAIQEETAPPPTTLPVTAAHPEVAQPGEVRIHGVGNLLTQMARCCKPLPPDPIIGYITRGRGVSIHRRDCPNILRTAGENRERLIEVDWSASTTQTYPVDIQIEAFDRQGLLRDITAILANEKIDVIAVNTLSDKVEHIARMQLTLEITDISQLSRVLAKIGQLPNVIEAHRRV